MMQGFVYEKMLLGNYKYSEDRSFLTGNEENPALVLSNVHNRISARDGPMFSSKGPSMNTSSLFRADVPAHSCGWRRCLTTWRAHSWSASCGASRGMRGRRCAALFSPTSAPPPTLLSRYQQNPEMFSVLRIRIRELVPV
jgi:hypothetical protein